MGDFWGIALGAGLTAIFGLIGLVVNFWREHRVWLRNQKLKVYSQLLLDIDLLRVAMHDLEGAPDGAPMDAVLDVIRKLDDNQMQLLAPSVINGVKDKTINALLDTSGLLGQPRTDENKNAYDDAQSAVGEGVAILKDLMRKDLGAREGLTPSALIRAFFVITRRRHAVRMD